MAEFSGGFALPSFACRSKGLNSRIDELAHRVLLDQVTGDIAK
jgi:hypothetical protein